MSLRIMHDAAWYLGRIGVGLGVGVGCLARGRGYEAAWYTKAEMGEG